MNLLSGEQPDGKTGLVQDLDNKINKVSFVKIWTIQKIRVQFSRTKQIVKIASSDIAWRSKYISYFVHHVRPRNKVLQPYFCGSQ